MQPILPDPAFAPLRAMREVGFTHQVVLRTFTRTRQPNGEYRETAADAEPIPGKLVAPDARAIERAAARGVAIQWVLKLRVDATATVGQHAVVTASAADGGWTRTVAVTLDLTGPTGRINRRFAAVDVPVTP